MPSILSGWRRSGMVRKDRIFNVATYGAVGNGVADDTTAIQSAMDAAGAVTPGGHVVLGPGTYMISAWLVYPSNIRVSGAGMAVTTIKNLTTRAETDTVMLIPLGNGSQDTHDVLFEGITWDQRADFYPLNENALTLSVDGTRNVTFQDCGFRNIRIIAIWCDSFPARPTLGHRVLRNHVYQSMGDGFSYFGEFRDFDISGNTIEHAKDDAIAVQDTGPGSSNGAPSNGVINDNVILNCDTQNAVGSTARGILVFGGNTVSVLRNQVTNTYASNYLVCFGVTRRSHDVILGENTGADAGLNNSGAGGTPSYGVFLYFSDNITVRNTTITNAKDGEYVYTSCTGVVDGGGNT